MTDIKVPNTGIQEALFEVDKKASPTKFRAFIGQARKLPQGAHNLIADTFVGKNGPMTLETGAKALVRPGLGYGAAAASGGTSAWLAHKFLPKSLQGAIRKLAVGGAGVGGAFLPSLVRRFIFKR